MRLSYPRPGSDRRFVFQERFVDPLSVQDNGGIITGATINRGMVCDGTNRRITYGRGPAPTPRMGKAWTVWWDATLGAVPALYGAIVARDVAGQREFEVGIQSDGRLYLNLPTGTPTSSIVWAAGERAQGCWVNVGVGTGSYAYKNGVACYSVPGGGSYLAAAATPLTIGCRGYAANEDYFKGTIHEVRIYERALLVAEVLALYNAREGW